MSDSNEEKTAAVDEGSGVDVRQYLHILWAHKWVILATTVVVASAVIGYTLRQPRIYEAACTIEYDPQPARPLGNRVEDGDAFGDFWMTQEFFATQNRIISSRAVALRVVDTMHLESAPWFFGVPAAGFEPRTREQAAGVLQGKLSVEPIRDTRVVEIRVTDQDPQHGADLANAVAAAYIEKTRHDRTESTQATLEWLERRRDEYRGALETSEFDLHHFKEDNHVLSVSMEDRQNLVASEIQAFNTALTEARTRRIALQARLTRIRAASAAGTEEESAAAFPDSETLAPLAEGLRLKLAESENLSARYGANHQQMQQLNAEISGIRQQVRAEIAAMLRAAQADVAEAQHVEAGLRQALEEAHTEGLALNLREIEYRGLNRERENNSKLYTVLLESHTQTELTHRQSDASYARLLDAALPPPFPISPNLTTNSLGGLGAGLVLGLALTLLLTQLDRRLKSVADVERLGLTVLGILPRISEGEPVQGHGGKRRRGAAAIAGPKRDLFVHTHPMSPAAECCRTIRTNLTFIGADTPIRTMVVTSAQPREGKTTVTANIAISLAQSGKRILLVDTDLRRPRIHRAFGVSGQTGITSIMVGEASLEDVVQATDIPNLDVLPCGPIPPNPSELFHSARFQGFVATALALYDRIIFDSPPLRAVTDAAVLAPQLDAVLVVVKAQETTRDALKSALRQLRDVKANVVGSVLNDVDPKRQSYGSGDYYHYYRREGYYHSASTDGDDPDEATAPSA